MIAFVVALGIATTPGFPAGCTFIDYLLPVILVTTASHAAVWWTITPHRQRINLA